MLNKPIFIIPVLIIITPFITPLLIKLYLSYVPGKLIGSIDGWIGFLGGYLGGFLSFLSAYLIYRQDKKVRERTFLVLKSTSPEKKFENETKCLFSNGILIEDDPARLVNFKINTPTLRTEIKNISSNFAKDINLILISKERHEVLPKLFEEFNNRYIQYDSIATLEPLESIAVDIRIDPSICKKAQYVDFKLVSCNLFGQSHVQKVRLHRNFSSNSFAFEMQT